MMIASDISVAVPGGDLNDACDGSRIGWLTTPGGGSGGMSKAPWNATEGCDRGENTTPTLMGGGWAADDHHMVTFWIWGVRNPCLLLAGLATATGATGIADWSLAMSTVLVFGVMAHAATHLARRAKARREREQAAILAMRRHDALIDGYRKHAA